MFATLVFIALQATQVSAATEAVQPPHIQNPRDFISSADYPATALRRGETGVVSVLLHVSADGKADSCTVTETAGSAGLDKATCTVFRRTKFDPARNAAGLAVATDYRASIAWGASGHFPSVDIALPLQVAKIPADYRSPVKGRVFLDGSGHIVGCEIEESSGSAPADRAACAYIRKSGFTFSPSPTSGTPGISPIAVRYFSAPLSNQLLEETK